MAGMAFKFLNDIAVLMDDTAVMTKVAAEKTAAVLGDDLAVGAEKSSKFSPSRELPVIWAITKGSFLNKLIILPLAFILSYFAPYLIAPILVIGGTYLAYEGFSKVYEFLQGKKENIDEIIKEENVKLDELKKVKSAIRTDFILSIEIIIIALSTVVGKNLIEQIIVVSIVAFLATVGVYGIVALLVRLDDVGIWLIKKKQVVIGNFLIQSLPYLIRGLEVIGTIAMFLVAGGIYVHNMHIPHINPLILEELFVGLIIGFISFTIIENFEKFKEKTK